MDQLITSSQFFSKSFFVADDDHIQIHPNQVSPWGLIPKNGHTIDPYLNKHYSSRDAHSLEITTNPQVNYQQRKQIVLRNVSKSRKLEAVAEKQQSPRYSPIKQQFSFQVSKKQRKPHSPTKLRQNPLFNIKLPNPMGKKRRKQQLFPQLTINQYNDIKAKANNNSSNYNSILNISGQIQEILEKRKYRRKILEFFRESKVKVGQPKTQKGDGGGHDSKDKKGSLVLPLVRKDDGESRDSIGMGNRAKMLSGRYVCIATKSGFMAMSGPPTINLIDEK